jgi:hypothetical protein
VGCLGIHFAYTFQVCQSPLFLDHLLTRNQHLCLSIPLLAPLLDGMVTSHVGERFTAQEALTFLDEAQSEMTREQLDTYPSIRTQVIAFDECDRWSDIPPSLIEKWGRYRERPPPYFVKHVIYPLCLRPWGVSLVYRIRVAFRWALFVCRLPLRMATHFLSL